MDPPPLSYWFSLQFGRFSYFECYSIPNICLNFPNSRGVFRSLVRGGGSGFVIVRVDPKWGEGIEVANKNSPPPLRFIK